MICATTDERDPQPRPARPSGLEVPAHLRGSRAAIFHLLRQAAAPEEPRPAQPAERPAAPATHPSGIRKRIVEAPVPNSVFLSFIQEDQFEFLSAASRTAAALGRIRAESGSPRKEMRPGPGGVAAA